MDFVSWPQADEAILIDSLVTIAVQVNGKLRATMEISPQITKEEVQELALKQPNAERFITGEIKKIIFVPGKLINIVV